MFKKLWNSFLRFIRRSKAPIRRRPLADSLRHLLDFDTLEGRVMPSISLMSPRPLGTAEHINAVSVDRGLSSDLGGSPTPLAVLQAGSATAAGEFTLLSAGDYTFEISITGTDGDGDTIEFFASGDIAFDADQAAELSNGQWTASLAHFFQEVAVTFSYEETDSGNNVLRTESGTDTYSLDETYTAPDAHWFFLNWYDVVGAISANYTLAMEDVTWTDLSVSEEGSSAFTLTQVDSYTLTGDATGGGTRTFTRVGATTLILTELGSYDANGLSLSKISYAESGTHNYIDTASGNSIQSGQSDPAGLYLFGVLGEAGIPLQSEFESSSFYDSERVGGGTFLFEEYGSYEAEEFSFAAVAFEETSAEASVYHAEEFSTRSGIVAAGAASGFIATNGSYEFESTESFTVDRVAAGTSDLSEWGAYAGGVFGLNTIVFSSTETANVQSSATTSQTRTGHIDARVSGDLEFLGADGTYDQTSFLTITTDVTSDLTETFDATASFYEGVLTISALIYDQSNTTTAVRQEIGVSTWEGQIEGHIGPDQLHFAANINADGSENIDRLQSRDSSGHLHQEGTFDSSGINLSSIVYDQTGTTSFTNTYDGGCNFSGSLEGELSIIGTGEALFTIDGHSTNSYDSSGSGTLALHHAGTYSEGELSLSSFQFTESSTSSYSNHEDAGYSWTATAWGEFNFANIIDTDLMAEFNAAGSDSNVRDEDGSATVDRHESGTLDAGVLNLSCISYDKTTDFSFTVTADSGYTYEGSASGEVDFFRLINANGTFSASGSANSSSTSSGNGSSSLHESGEFNGTVLNLSSISSDQSNTNSFSFHEDNSSAYDGTINANLDFELAGLSGTITLTGNESSSVDGSGGGSLTKHREGTRTDGVLDLSSLVLDSSTSYTFAEQATGSTHLDGEHSGFVNLFGNAATGSFEYENNTSYSLDTDGDSASTVHEEGTSAGQETNLSCIVMTDEAHESSSYHSADDSAYTATLAGQVELGLGLGAIGGVFTLTGSDDSTTDIDDQSDSSSYRAGSRLDDNPLNLSSITTDVSSTRSFTSHTSRFFRYEGHASGNLGGVLAGEFDIDGGDSFTYDDFGDSESTKHHEGSAEGADVDLSSVNEDSTSTLHYTSASEAHLSWSASASGQMTLLGASMTGDLSVSHDSSSTSQNEGDSFRHTHEEGASNDGAIDLSCMVIDETTDSAGTMSSESSTSYSGTVSGNLDFGIGNVHGTFTASGSSEDALDGSGSFHDHFYQAGTRDGGVTNLSSLVHDTSEEIDFTHTASGDWAMSGSATGNLTLLDNSLTATIGGSTSESFTIDEAGDFSKSSYEEGSRTDGALSLSCVVYTEESNATFEEHRTSTLTWNGSLSGNLNILTATINGAYSASGSETKTADYEGSRSESRYQAGGFDDDVYSLDSIALDESSSGTYSSQISGQSSYSGTFGGNINLGGANVNGNFTASSGESYASDFEGEFNATVHEEGQNIENELNLTCIVLSESGSGSASTDRSAQSSYSGTISGSYTSEGIGLVADFSIAGAESYTEHIESSGVRTLNEEGSYQNGSMSLTSIVATSATTSSFDEHQSGNSSYSGAGVGSGTIIAQATGNLNVSGSETHSSNSSGDRIATVYQGGSYYSGEMHLSSVTLDESTHAQFDYHQSGQSTYNGSINGSIGSAGNGLTGSFTAAGNESYSFDEEGTSTSVFHQEGQSDVGVLNLSSVSFDDSSASSFTNQRSGSTSFSGTVQGNLSAGDSGLNGTFSATGSVSFTRTERGDATDRRYEAGTYANSAYNLSSIVFDDTSSSTFVHHEAGSNNFSGTINGVIDLPIGSANGTFSVSGNESWVSDQSRVATKALHEAGTASGTNLHLSCVVYHTTNNGTTTSSTSGSSTFGGSFNGSAPLGAGSLGGNYSMSVSENHTRSDASFDSGTLHQEGAYSNGAISLSCIVLDASSTHSFTSQKDGQTGSNGTLTGNLNLGALSVSGNYNFNKGETWTEDSTGFEGKIKHMEGSLANGDLSLSCVLIDEASNSSYTYNAAGGSTWNGSFSGSVSVWIGSVSGTYTFGGNETHTLLRNGTRSESLHEAGSYANGQFTLNDVGFSFINLSTSNYDETGVRTGDITVQGSVLGFSHEETFPIADGSYTKHEQINANVVVHQGGSFANNALSLNSYVYEDGGSNTYHYNDHDSYSYADANGTGTDDYIADEVGTRTFHTRQAGQYVNGSLVLNSVTFDETGSYARDVQRQGGGTWIEQETVQGYFGTETVTADGANAYSSQDINNTTYVIHATGQYSADAFTFDSFVRDQSSSQTVTFQETGTETRTGAGTLGGNAYTSSAAVTYSYTSLTATNSTLHEAGTFANGVFDLPCHVYDENGQTSYTSDEAVAGTVAMSFFVGANNKQSHESAQSQYELHQEGSSYAGVLSLTSYVYDSSSAFTLTTHEDGVQSHSYINTGSTDSGQDRFTKDSGSNQISTIHEAGTYGSGGYNLSCYVHDKTSNESAAETHDSLHFTSSTTATTADSAQTHTISDTNSDHTSHLYEAGTYTGDAGFNLSSYLFDESSNSAQNLTVELATTSIYSVTDYNTSTTFDSLAHTNSTHATTLHSTGTLGSGGLNLNCYVYDEESTADSDLHSVTATTNTQATATTGSTSQTTTTVDQTSYVASDLHEAGTYAAGAFNLSCYVYDHTTAVTLETEVANVSASTYTPYAEYVQTTTASTVQYDALETTTDLHTEGTYGSTGLNLSCYLYDETAGATHQFVESTTNLIEWTSTDSSWSHETTTDTSDATVTVTVLHQAGTYSEGAYNFSSYTLDTQSAQTYAYDNQWIDTAASSDSENASSSLTSTTYEDTRHRTTYLHEEGTSINYEIDLSCYVYDEATDEQITTTQDSASTSTHSSASYDSANFASSNRVDDSISTMQLHTAGAFDYYTGLDLTEYTSTTDSATSYVLTQSSSYSYSDANTDSDSSSSRDEEGATESHVFGEGTYNPTDGLTLTTYTHDQTSSLSYTAHQESHSSSSYGSGDSTNSSASTSTNDQTFESASTLHEAGTYEGGAFDLTTYTFDADSSTNSTTDGSSESASTYTSGSYASHTHYNSTSHSEYDRTTDLHEEGTYESATGFSLSCYLYGENAATSTDDHSDSDGDYGDESYAYTSSYQSDSESSATFTLHAEGTYDPTDGLSLSSYSSTSESDSASTSHQDWSATGTDYSHSRFTNWTSSSSTYNHQAGTVDIGVLSLASYVSDTSSEWDTYSEYHYDTASTDPYVSTGHTWGDAQYHLEGSGISAAWTNDQSGGYAYTATGSDASTDSWTSHDEDTTTISGYFQGVPVELQGPVFAFIMPGPTLTIRFEFPPVTLIVPGVEILTNIVNGVVMPAPIDGDLLIPVQGNRQILPQVAPNAQVGNNPGGGIRGNGDAARAAREFAQQIDNAVLPAQNINGNAIGVPPAPGLGQIFMQPPPVRAANAELPPFDPMPPPQQPVQAAPEQPAAPPGQGGQLFAQILLPVPQQPPQPGFGRGVMPDPVDDFLGHLGAGLLEGILPFSPLYFSPPQPDTWSGVAGRTTGHVIGIAVGLAEIVGGVGSIPAEGGVAVVSGGTLALPMGAAAVGSVVVVVAGAVTVVQDIVLVVGDIRLMMTINELGHQPGGGPRRVPEEQGPFLGDNPNWDGHRVNTNLRGGEAEARRLFDRLTGGNNRPEGGQLVGPNGQRLRQARDGTWRIEIPAHGNTPHETIHFN